jgi:hypothetical protein
MNNESPLSLSYDEDQRFRRIHDVKRTLLSLFDRFSERCNESDEKIREHLAYLERTKGMEQFVPVQPAVPVLEYSAAGLFSAPYGAGIDGNADNRDLNRGNNSCCNIS